MAIAVATTLASHPPADGIAWLLVVLGIAIGGSIGAVIARLADELRRQADSFLELDDFKASIGRTGKS